MLYFFLKPLVKVALKVYFRNIYFSGKENIPDNKAFIIAMNHPSAFLEPVIMAVNIKKPVHFLVRGDHFNKLFYRFLLKQGKMIPVFRQKESGFGSLKNNYDTFSRCYQHIANGDIIALFPEGRTENEKRLRPLQRGIARIAFGTLFNYPEMQDLFVLPVSVNYTEPLIFRGTAYLHVGNPLSVKDYINSEQVPDYHQLLIDLAVELKKNMIIIENESDENLVEFCLMMTRNLNSYSFLPVYNNQDGRLRLEQKVSHFWNYHASEELKFASSPLYITVVSDLFIYASYKFSKTSIKSSSFEFSISSIAYSMSSFDGSPKNVLLKKFVSEITRLTIRVKSLSVSLTILFILFYFIYKYINK